MYSQAVEMYQLLECRNFGDYHDVYLQIDVYLLAGCFRVVPNCVYFSVSLRSRVFLQCSKFELGCYAGNNRGTIKFSR